MKTLDLTTDSSETHLKALVYGRPGTGKTSLGVSAPKPLILLSEGHAAPNIRKAAQRLGRPIPPVLFMETLEDYRNVVRALHGDKSRPFVVFDETNCEVLRLEEWPETIVIDSLTDAMVRVEGDIDTASPPKIGKDGLPARSLKFWGVLKDKGGKLIRAFRDAPVHVLFLALLDDKTIGEGDDAQRYMGPQLSSRAIPNLAMAAVSVVGITYRSRSNEKDESGERPYVYGIRTAGPSYMETKPFPPLRHNEVTDFASWVDRVNGIDDNTQAPPPMEEAPAIENN